MSISIMGGGDGCEYPSPDELVKFQLYFVDVCHRLVYYFEEQNPYHFHYLVIELLLTTLSCV